MNTDKIPPQMGTFLDICPVSYPCFSTSKFLSLLNSVDTATTEAKPKIYNFIKLLHSAKCHSGKISGGQVILQKRHGAKLHVNRV